MNKLYLIFLTLTYALMSESHAVDAEMVKFLKREFPWVSLGLGEHYGSPTPEKFKELAQKHLRNKGFSRMRAISLVDEMTVPIEEAYQALLEIGEQEKATRENSNSPNPSKSKKPTAWKNRSPLLKDSLDTMLEAKDESEDAGGEEIALQQSYSGEPTRFHLLLALTLQKLNNTIPGMTLKLGNSEIPVEEIMKLNIMRFAPDLAVNLLSQIREKWNANKGFLGRIKDRIGRGFRNIANYIGGR